MDVVSKTYNKTLLQKKRPDLETLLRVNRNSLVKIDQQNNSISTLRLSEEIKSNKLPTAVPFFDFSNAFDSIHSLTLTKTMEVCGVPP